MAKARSDGLLDEQVYRAQSLRFWRVLFFGPKGDNGRIPTFMKGLDDGARSAFIAEMRSPRLSAAMTLWCTFDWAGAEAEAKQFRFSTALLASRHRWLSEGGEHDALMEELQKLAEKLFPASRQKDLFEAWVRWVGDGHALAKIYEAFGLRPQGELAKFCTRPAVKAGELAWQSGRGLCVSDHDIARVPKGKAHLRPVDGSDPILVQSMFVAPLLDILKADNTLAEPIKRRAFDLLIGINLRPFSPPG